MTFIQVINHVLGEISPSLKERREAEATAYEVKMMILNSLKEEGIKGEVVFGGSFARRTYLHGIHDIDIFVRFKQQKDMDKFEKIVKNVFPDAEKIKGSRDYFNAKYKGIKFEFIPVLLVKSPMEAVNSMDASVFHVDYINSRLNDALRNEVFLLKQFCKGTGAYGAESHIGGFSGYVIELLILHFGSFKRFLEFINTSSGRIFIDMEGYYDSVSDGLRALKVNKLLTPMVIVDPVLPTRNAAAGLTRESFDRFVLQARLFLLNPRKSFFIVKKRTVGDLRELASLRGHHLFIHKFSGKGRKEVFLSKLKKELSKMKLFLEREEFSVYDYGVLEDGTAFFELEQAVLPRAKRVIGPPVTIDEEHFKSFIDKKAINGPYVLEGRVCFDVEREHHLAKPLVEKLFRKIKL